MFSVSFRRSPSALNFQLSSRSGWSQIPTMETPLARLCLILCVWHGLWYSVSAIRPVCTVYRNWKSSSDTSLGILCTYVGSDSRSFDDVLMDESVRYEGQPFSVFAPNATEISCDTPGGHMVIKNGSLIIGSNLESFKFDAVYGCPQRQEDKYTLTMSETELKNFPNPTEISPSGYELANSTIHTVKSVKNQTKN